MQPPNSPGSLRGASEKWKQQWPGSSETAICCWEPHAVGQHRSTLTTLASPVKAEAAGLAGRPSQGGALMPDNRISIL